MRPLAVLALLHIPSFLVLRLVQLLSNVPADYISAVSVNNCAFAHDLDLEKQMYADVEVFCLAFTMID
jgi:hypothetical protein